MKNILTICFLALLGGQAMAQTYPFGETTITFNDPARTGGFGNGGGPGRQIETKIYYPAATQGLNTPVANGQFPVIVFGHGFVMTWDSYEPLYDSLAAHGFIVALPRTEGGFAPVHLDFGKDLAIVSDRMLLENGVQGSLFFGKINGRKAIAGHSMGGGSTILSAQFTTGLNCMFTLAAANTNPSAIAAAPNVLVPNLVIAGSRDCVAPPAQHQDPIYAAIGADCKTYVNITDAYHCQFGGYNFNCDFGELTCRQAGGLDRDAQLDYVRALLYPYLNYFLKGDCAAWDEFTNLITNANWLTYQNTCNPQFPNPAIAGIGNICAGASTTLTASGGTSYAWSTGETTAEITVTPLATTTYTVTVSTPNGCSETANQTVAVTALSPALTFDGAQLSTDPGFASYAWDLDGAPLAGANGPTYSPSQNGNYSVTVTDANGCTASASYLLTGVGVFSAPLSGVEAYPNPTTGALNIVGLPIGASIWVWNGLGQLVFQTKSTASMEQITLDAFPAGVYGIEVQMGRQSVLRKIVKE